MPDTVIRARIDSGTKKAATKVFNRLGLSMSDAIRIFLRHSVEYKGLPFALRLPNKETIEAIKELDHGGGKKVTVEELRREIEEEE